MFRGYGLHTLLEPNDATERPEDSHRRFLIDTRLQGPLSGWATSLIDQSRLRSEGFFHPGPIAKMWSQHLAGTHEWGYLLWNVLMFQAWLDVQSQTPATLDLVNEAERQPDHA